MSALRDPLVPAEVDLRDFKYMELDVGTLRDSKFAAEVDPEAFRAGVLLWCAAWHQVPAASLPNNDKELSQLAGFGRVVKEWAKYRDEALSLFELCSDGRLYHRLIAEKANTAWLSKLRHHYDRARDRLRKANKARELAKLSPLPEFGFEQWNAARIAKGIPMERAEAAEGIPLIEPPASAGIPPENTLKGNREGTGEGKGEGDFKDSVPDGTGGKPPAAPPAPPPKREAKTPAEEEKSHLWAALKVSLVEQKTCADYKAAGVLLGKHASKYGQDVFLVAARQTVAAEPVDANTYLVGLCETAAGKRHRLNGQLSEAERQAANATANAQAALLLSGTPNSAGQEAIDA